MELLPIKRALLSVTDKSGLGDFAAFLVKNGVELVSTGGTFTFLQNEGLPVTPVEKVTNFPEIMGGRVKTLHPAIHGGILADKDNPAHLSAIAGLGIAPFDLVCVNLYNFAEAAKKGLPPREAIEQIDIGGPCMLRASAKNYHSVLVVPAASWYERITEDLLNNGMQASLELRKTMARATFAATAAYDAMITQYFTLH